MADRGRDRDEAGPGPPGGGGPGPGTAQPSCRNQVVPSGGALTVAENG